MKKQWNILLLSSDFFNLLFVLTYIVLFLLLFKGCDSNFVTKKYNKLKVATNETTNLH